MSWCVRHDFASAHQKITAAKGRRAWKMGGACAVNDTKLKIGSEGWERLEIVKQMLLETFFSSSNAKSDYAEGFRKPVRVALRVS